MSTYSINKIIIVLYATLIAWLSLSPATFSEPWFPHKDKVLHFLAYSFFVLICSPFLRTVSMRMYICAGVWLFAGAMELGQLFVPGRDTSWLDMLANTFGAAFGCYLAVNWFPVWRDKLCICRSNK